MSFYVTGGTLQHDAPSYVERRADQELLQALREGEFCYVLTSRQMGKSSLMVRTATRLRAEGAWVVALDLTAIGGLNLTPDQWYYGVLDLLGEQLGLETELEPFWRGNADLGSLQRLMKAIRHVILPRLAERDRAGRNPARAHPTPQTREAPSPAAPAGRLVIFVDEIDVVRSLPFPTADFFAAIRECYNHRTQDPVYARLTFCLLGVATPSDLIQDPRTTPFNIGRRIELTDFTPEEALPLAHGLVRPQEDTRLALALLQRVFYWAGGHPYLTQRLCRAIAETLREKAPSTPHDPRPRSLGSAARTVDALCTGLFFSPRAHERDDNLIFVRERLLRSGADVASVLELYLKIRRGLHVPDDDLDPLVSSLHLAGIVRSSGGRLRERNRIYHRAFNPDWVRAHMPEAELRRLREAYYRGVWRAAAISAAVLAGMALLVFIAVKQSAQAYFSQARALRLGGQQGQRTESLTAISKAVRWHPDKLALRNEAIASLALVDLAPASDLWGGRPPPPSAVLTPDFERYVERGPGGTLILRNAWTREPILELPGPGVVAKRLFFSPDGRFLAVQHEGKELGPTRVWDCGRQCLLPGPTEPIARGGVAFSADSRRLALTVHRADLAHLEVYDLEKPESKPLTSRPLATNYLREAHAPQFHPTNHDVLAECSPQDQEVRVWNLQDGSITTDFFPDKVQDLSWHPLGYSLAVACDDRKVYLVPYPPTPTPGKPRPQRRGFRLHDAAVVAVSFNHRGDLLASLGKDQSLRLWLPATERVMSLHAVETGRVAELQHLRFSADDRYLEATAADGTSGAAWRLLGDEYRVLGGLGHSEESPVTLDFSPDGHVLVAAFRDSIHFWDAVSGRRLGLLQVRAKIAEAARFEPSGGGERRLLVSTREGLERHRLRVDHDGGISRLVEDPQPQRWPQNGLGGRGFGVFDLAPQCRKAAIVHQDRIRVLNLDSFSEQGGETPSAGQRSYRALALSPDGRWAAALHYAAGAEERSQEANALELWNLAPEPQLSSGERLYSTEFFSFSPDGRWLVTRWQGVLDFHRVGAWDAPPARPIERDSPPVEAAPFAFSPAGSLFAVAYSRLPVRLYRLDESPALRAQEIATLESPDRVLVRLLVFSPDGRWLAAAGPERLIQLWDLHQVRDGLAALKLAKGFPVPGAGPGLADHRP